jgi:hypothetical protein
LSVWRRAFVRVGRRLDQVKADTPVMARPMSSFCTWDVPS